MARAVIGGLCSSMLITLLVIPVVYSFFESGFGRARRHPPSLPLLVLAVGVLLGPVAHAEPAARGVEPSASLTLGDTVVLALERNRAIAVQRLAPAIYATFEDEARAVFDPALSGTLFQERARTAPDDPDDTRETADTVFGGSLRVGQTWPTGTRIEAGLDAERDDTADGPDRVGAGARLSVTQSLLRGRPRAVNLAALTQARFDTAMSRYEFRAAVEALVADVEIAYWETVLARQRTVIYEEALALAERQLAEIEQRIRVGSLPETERASAQAETAVRREELINARSAQTLAALRLFRLVDPDRLVAPGRNWTPTTAPTAPDAGADALSDHLRLALQQRPDLNQARLLLDKQDVDLETTRNGLLPKLDFFILLGDTGYADSFGRAVDRMDGDRLDYRAGLELQVPLGNRDARARHRRALLELDQAYGALSNMTDLARVDVESAYIETQRTREQITATATTRRFQEEKLRAETAKFQVGRSTSLLVAQAQQDRVNSQVAEVKAAVEHLQALVRLFRMDGSLLLRRGIQIPDTAPRGK